MKDKFEINVDEFGANKPFGITIDAPLKQSTIIDPPFLSFSVGQRKVGEFREADGQLQFTGDAQASASVFIDHVFMSYGSKMSELKDERDALAAQRDEGLAREAELNRRISALEGDGSWGEMALTVKVEALQQRLAEATDLLKHMTCSYHRALENGYDRIIFLGGDCDSVERMEGDDPFYAKARAFLAIPGCADGEKS